MPEQRSDDPQGLAERLYDTHGPSLFRYAVMLLADPCAAEDAVQQVFCMLLQPGRINAVKEHAHYLRRAVRNQCYSTLRQRQARGSEVSDATLLEPLAAEPVAPDERVALERAIRTLSADQREVVHLHVFEGFTFQEIADASNESINTVAGRYRYALKHLRNHLAELS